MIAEQVTATDVRGGFDRRGGWHEPSYWPRRGQMTGAEGVSVTIDEALLRSSARVACLGGNSRDAVTKAQGTSCRERGF